jgi:hypothetical protein
MALAAFISTNARAKDGRDFAGFYQVESVSQQGQNYSLRLAVRVFNYFDADVANAQVVLHDSVQVQKQYATFSGNAITNHGNIVLKTAQISIPSREFQWWQKHGPPVQIEFKTPDGQNHLQNVELISRAVGE